MQTPALDDTIVAVSTGWEPAPLAILRVSGPASFALVETLGAPRPTTFPCICTTRVHLPPAPARLSKPAITSRCDTALQRCQPAETDAFPAHVMFFRGPASYTGQDLVELHVPGALPLVRVLADALIHAGGRRALPGEFTARAFLSGKLDAEQVDGVLATLTATDAATARHAARSRQDSLHKIIAAIRATLGELLAAVEGSIDFVEEEDVRLIEHDALRAALRDVEQQLDTTLQDDTTPIRAARPHVALVGPPNAGKSTLFNALLGEQRAIVSPTLGTTRDVLSAEIDFEGTPAILQDCAGLGATVNEIDRAAHVAAEETLAQADLVLWVQASSEPCSVAAEACERIPADRRILVQSKCDQAAGQVTAEACFPAFEETVPVAALAGKGLAELRRAVAARLRLRPRAETTDVGSRDELSGVHKAIARARHLCETSDNWETHADLIAFELREAANALREFGDATLDEQVLGRIMTRFCVGK